MACRDIVRLRPTMAGIASDVAEAHGLTVGQLRARYGDSVSIGARHQAMAQMVAAGFTSGQVGGYFGRDPHNVLYGCRRANGESYAQIRAGRS